MKTDNMFNLFLLAFVTILTRTSQAAIQCENLFIEARQSLAQYKSSAKERSKSLAPKYSNPQYEMMAAKTWNGVKGPQILQAMLPEGIAFIDHALKGANEEGVVKTSSGSMVHLRAKIGDVGTNLGVNIAALKDNLSRDKKSLVRESADAVIVFVHGGGTKTTGHHVAASMMSWMSVRNVDVISLDMPWHGEGARTSFENAKASLDQMREYVEKFVAPAGKPIILVGHSMGGVVSDLYMRMFPGDKLFSGVVPLSTVADALPGGSVQDKILQEALIAERNKTNINIPESERDLSEWLARQNKISPTCGMYCQVLMFGINWDIPTHNGKDYLPSLYIIGSGDGLYQGYEKSFADGVSQLAKAEVKVLDQRRDIKDKDGKLITIGHLIFDHKPRIDFADDLPDAVKKSILTATIKEADFNKLRAEGKITLDPAFTFDDIADQETFVLVRNFIRKITGKSLDRVKVDNSPLELVAQAYANNLAFREFAKTYIFQHMKATERAAIIGQEMNRLQDKVRSFAYIKKQNNGKLTDEQKAELDQVTAKFSELSSIQAQKGEVSSENRERYEELQAQLQKLNTVTGQALTAERKQLKAQLDEKKKIILRAEKTMAEFEKSISSKKMAQIFQAKERAFSLLMKQDRKVRELTNAYLFTSYSNGKFAKGVFENLPLSTVREFEKYEKIADLYQSVLRKYEMILMQEAREGRLEYKGEASRKEEVEMRLKEAALAATSASIDIQNILARLDQLDKEATDLANQTFKLEKQMVALTGGNYFNPEYYTLEQLLSQNVESARSNRDGMSGILQRIWADWQKIWSVRIAESNESLY